MNHINEHYKQILILVNNFTDLNILSSEHNNISVVNLVCKLQGDFNKE